RGSRRAGCLTILKMGFGFCANGFVLAERGSYQIAMTQIMRDVLRLFLELSGKRFHAGRHLKNEQKETKETKIVESLALNKKVERSRQPRRAVFKSNLGSTESRPTAFVSIVVFCSIIWSRGSQHLRQMNGLQFFALAIEQPLQLHQATGIIGDNIFGIGL